MRAALQDGKFLRTISDQNGCSEVVGICLGADYAAEHEQGIEGIKESFNIKNTLTSGLFRRTRPLMGFDRCKINTNHINIYTASLDSIKVFEDEKENIDIKEVIIITSNKSLNKDSVLGCYTHRSFYDENMKFKFWCAWDQDDFIIILESTPDSLAISRIFQKAFEKRDIVIFLNHISGIENSGLTIYIHSKLSEDVLAVATKTDREHISLLNLRDTSPAYLRWKQVKKDWEKLHPNCSSSPWNVFSFEKVCKGKDDDLLIWLNPSHQTHLNAGWLCEQDIQDWLEGKSGRVIKSQKLWDELIWLCTLPFDSTGVLIGYQLHFFNRFPAEYLLSTKNFPKKMQVGEKGDKRLSPEMIETVEKHIKYLMIDDYDKQLRWNGKKIHEILSISREVRQEIYGFFSCLSKLGLQIQEGATNTPKVRENFSWWMDLLEDESLFEVWVKHGFAYKPWVDNGYSEFMKHQYIEYCSNDFHDQDEEYAILKAKIKE